MSTGKENSIKVLYLSISELHEEFKEAKKEQKAYHDAILEQFKKLETPKEETNSFDYENIREENHHLKQYLTDVLNQFNDVSSDFIHQINQTNQKQIESLKTQKNNLIYLYIGLVLSVLGIICMLIGYFFGIKTKLEVKEAYHKELIQNNQYMNSEQANFLEKYDAWAKKNPKDNQLFIKKIKQK